VEVAMAVVIDDDSEAVTETEVATEVVVVVMVMEVVGIITGITDDHVQIKDERQFCKNYHLMTSIKFSHNDPHPKRENKPIHQSIGEPINE
jgi:hypothetical protein